MFDLNQELADIRRKLDLMNADEFDTMLEQCGITHIKASINSDYVKCLQKEFPQTGKTYDKKPKYLLSVEEEYYHYDLDFEGAA